MNRRTLAVFVLAGASVLAVIAGCTKRSPDLTVKGTVTDAATGQPIQGAVISDGQYGPPPAGPVVTDAAGKYSYATWSEEHNITATAAGYKLLVLSSNDVRKEHTLDFKLTRNGQTVPQPDVAQPVHRENAE
jgi:hypothetical protein